MRSKERLREWIWRLVKPEVDAYLERERETVNLLADDPLLLQRTNASRIADQLKNAANVVGQNVVVGRAVILWGGRTTTCRGLELHDGVRLYDYCRLVIDQLNPSSGIVLNERVALNFGCYVDGSGGVIVGSGTIFGPNVVVVSSGHIVDADFPVQDSGKVFGAVTIGKDVWIGANAVILMGVTIGNGAVVGAGSIVTTNVPENAVVAGNPAKILRLKKG